MRHQLAQHPRKTPDAGLGAGRLANSNRGSRSDAPFSAAPIPTRSAMRQGVARGPHRVTALWVKARARPCGGFVGPAERLSVMQTEHSIAPEFDRDRDQAQS